MDACQRTRTCVRARNGQRSSAPPLDPLEPSPHRFTELPHFDDGLIQEVAHHLAALLGDRPQTLRGLAGVAAAEGQAERVRQAVWLLEALEVANPRGDGHRAGMPDARHRFQQFPLLIVGGPLCRLRITKPFSPRRFTVNSRFCWSIRRENIRGSPGKSKTWGYRTLPSLLFLEIPSLSWNLESPAGP